MKPPKSLLQIFAILSLVLGLVFLLSGALCQVGILQTSPHSKGDPAVIFPLLGVSLITISLPMLLLARTQNLEALGLRSGDGVRVDGLVTQVKHLRYTHWCGRSPYVLHYAYSYEGERFVGKTELLWEEPKLHQGDVLPLYVDAQKPQKSVVY